MKTVSIRLDDKTKKQLDDLLQYLQDKSFGTVTTTDVIKAAISEMHENYVPEEEKNK